MDEEKLYLENKPLIYMAIKDKHIYCKTEDEFQEYYDAGVDGLLKGIRTYDETKGYKISTYLYTCICNELKHKITKINTKKRKNEYGRDLSLNKIIDTDENGLTEFGDFIPDPNINIEEDLEKEIEKAKILYAVNQLQNEKDKLIIKMYYGLDGYEELGNYREIAFVLGLSKQRIYMRYQRAYKKIKEIYEKANDKDFLKEKKEESIWME